MSTTSTKLSQRFARAVVRVWPTESREWGQAFAAELPAVESGSAATSWLLGGLMLLLREWLKHAWRSLGRPLGTNPDDAANAAFSPRYFRNPRTPLWLTLALTAASIAILLHPEVHQALRKLSAEYSSQPGWQPETWSSTKKLRELSRSNRDPQLLGLLSLLSQDNNQRLALSDEAIRKDSSLTWLDYEQSFLPANDFAPEAHLSKERLDRLQKWDPNNAVPRMLTAEIIAKPPRVEPLDMLIPSRNKTSREKTLADNPQWASAMHAVFAAPKFDDYVPQLVELVRNVSSRFSVRDPEIAFYVLSMRRGIRFDLARGYADAMVAHASTLQSSGKTAEAIGAYTEILQFAQRVSLGPESPADELFAEQIGEDAAQKLVPLYDSLGRHEEASLIRFQLEKWTAEHDPKILRYVPVHYRWSQWSSLAWSGLIISVAGFALSIVVPITLIALSIVVRRRKTSFDKRNAIDFWASLCSDSAPWRLFASSVLLYITYHPYARVCSAFLKGGDTSPSIETFLTAAMVPDIVPDFAEFAYDSYSRWIGITAALGVLLVYFLWRMMLRRTKTMA